MNALEKLFAKLQAECPVDAAKATRRGATRTNPNDNRQDPMAVNNGPSIGGEVDLWVAVILQALSDARSGAHFGNDEGGARAFLTAYHGEFARSRHLICEIIGIDPDWLARKAEEYLDARDRGYIVRGGRRVKKTEANAPRKKMGERIDAVAA